MNSNWDKYSGLTRLAPLWLTFLVSCCSFPVRADHYPTVGGPVWTNGQFQFKLGGTAGMPYAIESSPDLINWQPVVTNSDPTNSRIIQLASTPNANFFRARTIPTPPVHVGLGVRNNISFISGHGIITDSYNSALMQAASKSGRPILLHYSTTGGHSAGVSVDQHIQDDADELTFLWTETGQPGRARAK